jgi:hypothetical protein
MTAVEPLSTFAPSAADSAVEEILAVAEDGSVVVLVIEDGGRRQTYEYRRAGTVVAQAPNLRLLAALVADDG